jgi:hypothetical protein
MPNGHRLNLYYSELMEGLAAVQEGGNTSAALCGFLVPSLDWVLLARAVPILSGEGLGAQIH